MLGRKTLHVTGEFAAVNSICEVGGSSASEDEEGCVVCSGVECAKVSAILLRTWDEQRMRKPTG